MYIIKILAFTMKNYIFKDISLQIVFKMYEIDLNKENNSI